MTYRGGGGMAALSHAALPHELRQAAPPLAAQRQHPDLDPSFLLLQRAVDYMARCGEWFAGLFGAAEGSCCPQSPPIHIPCWLADQPARSPPNHPAAATLLAPAARSQAQQNQGDAVCQPGTRPAPQDCRVCAVLPARCADSRQAAAEAAMAGAPALLLPA